MPLRGHVLRRLPLPKNSVYWFVLCFLSVAKDHLFNISEGGK
jgi:hypothetical protein